MLTASRTSAWRHRYRAERDGRPVAEWRRAGGRTLELAAGGRHYRVRGNLWGTRYEMTDESGAVVATADGVGRRSWSVQAGGRVHHLRRASVWRSDLQLLGPGGPVGYVRRSGFWRAVTAADLPGLDPAVQVFVLVLAAELYDRQQESAAASA